MPHNIYHIHAPGLGYTTRLHTPRTVRSAVVWQLPSGAMQLRAFGNQETANRNAASLADTYGRDHVELATITQE